MPKRREKSRGYKVFRLGVANLLLVRSDLGEMVLAGAMPDSVPGQWSYQVGPCRGIELGDHLWLSRYLLLRLSEQFKVTTHRIWRMSVR